MQDNFFSPAFSYNLILTASSLLTASIKHHSGFCFLHSRIVFIIFEISLGVTPEKSIPSVEICILSVFMNLFARAKLTGLNIRAVGNISRKHLLPSVEISIRIYSTTISTVSPSALSISTSFPITPSSIICIILLQSTLIP